MNTKPLFTTFMFFGQKMTVIYFLFWAGFLAALSGLAVATAAGFLGHLDWRLDLFSHLRMQYLIAAVVLLVISLWSRKYWLSGATAAVGLANLIPLLPLLMFAPGVDAAGETLRINFINVSNDNETPEEVVAFVAETDPDIIFLSEVTEQHRGAMAELWEQYPHSANDGKHNYFLSRLPIESSYVDQPEAERPILLVRFNHQGQLLTAIGIHTQRPSDRVHWSMRNADLETVATFARQESNPVVMIGDFNVTSYSPIFAKLLEDGGFKDGRDHQGINGTWPNVPLLRIPIDHFVATTEITVQNLEAGRFVGSDHLPLVIDFAIAPVE